MCATQTKAQRPISAFWIKNIIFDFIGENCEELSVFWQVEIIMEIED